MEKPPSSLIEIENLFDNTNFHPAFQATAKKPSIEKQVKHFTQIIFFKERR